MKQLEFMEHMEVVAKVLDMAVERRQFPDSEQIKRDFDEAVDAYMKRGVELKEAGVIK